MPSALIARLFFWIWFGAAVATGHFLVLQRLPPFTVPGIIFALTGGVLFGYFRLTAVRTWVDSLELRALLLFHLSRFVGIYFLILYQRGELPREFAVPGGLGDIAVATMALPVAFAPLAPGPRLRAILIWNVVGFIDLLMVLVSAIRIIFTDPSQLRPLTHLPLSLLPTFLVPLLLATHVVIFGRALQPQRAT